jgi:hypothetical protein
MAVLFRWYDRACLYIPNGTTESTTTIGSASISLASQPLTCCLLTSTYTWSASHTIYANLTNELTTVGGYTAGGLAMTTLALTQAGIATNFTADNPSWTASGAGIAAFRYAVVYINATIGGIVKPLLFAADNNGVDVPATVAPNPLTVTWNATGVFQVGHS